MVEELAAKRELRVLRALLKQDALLSYCWQLCLVVGRCLERLIKERQTSLPLKELSRKQVRWWAAVATVGILTVPGQCVHKPGPTGSWKRILGHE